ncbi:acyltransferase family protein [Pelagicoccus mobilis]|uniref:Acyltransferase family protein n=1 Tax=Pelagicoccus mobilis TaxID=415221 RepID=A0A934VTX9_9BACT|nr:acyltransferase family protein [Pelagicoccus mobilis]MBK1880535.1 acyltransferase family protein [Pelagicoccus mobilis]
MTATTLTNRLDYLDAVRAFALLLGIVFHAALSFVPIYIGWAVMDVSTSPLVLIFILVSHSFRMELFFLIAGFFSHMTFHKRGSGSFLKSRFVRIAIPFVIGWFILRPLIVSGWAMGAESLRGDVNILNGLIIGFGSLSELPSGILVGTHLWFLYYLLLITSLFLLVRSTMRFSDRFRKAIQKTGDSLVHWLSTSRFAFVALAIPTAIALNFMSQWGMDTPDLSLTPHIPATLIYGGFFAFGWVLHRTPALIGNFSRLTIGRFVIFILSAAATIILSDYQADTGNPYYGFIKAAFCLSYSFMMWTLVALCIGLFKRFLDRPNKAVRYIADASYWLYLIHLPIVVWLQVAFAELEFHWSIKLGCISALTIGISLLMYDLLVRSTFIGKTLNGRKKKRVLFSSNSEGQQSVVAATSQQ